MAWRSGVIVNALAGRAVYETEPSSSPLTWSTLPREGGIQARKGCR
jgi:hypothetical protein